MSHTSTFQLPIVPLDTSQPLADQSSPSSQTPSLSTSASPLQQNPPQPSHPMITRGKAGIFKPKVWTTQRKKDWSVTEPTRVKEALLTPQWKEAMDLKFQVLKQNQTWHLIPPLPSMNIVGNKWIFRIKRNADGSIQIYKARFMVKGFHQTPGIDFFETFSPVVRHPPSESY